MGLFASRKRRDLPPNVVISQTNRLVSQERLRPGAGTSVFIDLIPIITSSEVLIFETSMSHHTPPTPGGVGINRQFLIF